MKRKRIILATLITFVMVFVVTLCFTSNVHAAEETAQATEAIEKTSGAKTLEDYFGWFVGIPVGSVVTVALNVLFLLVKRKDYKTDLSSNLTQRESLNQFVYESKTTQTKMLDTVKEYEAQFNKLEEKLRKLDEDIAEKTKKDAELITSNENVSAKVDELTKILALMASHDKDLVANGTAEKINALINE